MPLDQPALARGCGGTLRTAEQLCRRQLGAYQGALATGAAVTVGCTQEAPLFTEAAGEAGAEERVAFVNVREAAGWSDEGDRAGPKMAALLAAVSEQPPPASLVSLESRGVALVYGRDETAIAAAGRLADHLDITVLLTGAEAVAPPRSTEFPVLQGTITAAKGHLGAFALRIDGFAEPRPSSRGALVFGPARDGATSHCDLILDLSGGAPMFAGDDLRSGYLRADPRDPAAVARLVFEASHLVGTFDKPRYIAFTESLCAHSRSGITGCTRCLEVCPAGAITPGGNAGGDAVAIDPAICAGCGNCAAVCPTGAASYALPPVDALMRRLRTLLSAYRAAGGQTPVLLFHDEAHGAPLIEALGRYGAGLPAHVIPVGVNEVTQIGIEALAAAFALGAAGARILARARARHDLASLHRTVATANTILSGLGYAARMGEAVLGPVSVIETDDPDALRATLDRLPAGTPAPEPASFRAAGAKRGVLELAFRELRRVAPDPVDVIPLGPGAPFGGLAFDIESCTLCLSCVGACPTAALTDNPERPTLRFTESLCVQCGLCAATCPEDVITLTPQIDFAAWEAPRRLVKEEDPFPCVACGKPFGTRGAIERVVERLGASHWMFAGPDGAARLRLLMMCADCRVEAAVNQNFDPHALPPRPLPRIAADEIAEPAPAKRGPAQSIFE